MWKFGSYHNNHDIFSCLILISGPFAKHSSLESLTSGLSFLLSGRRFPGCTAVATDVFLFSYPKRGRHLIVFFRIHVNSGVTSSKKMELVRNFLRLNRLLERLHSWLQYFTHDTYSPTQLHQGTTCHCVAFQPVGGLKTKGPLLVPQAAEYRQNTCPHPGQWR